MASKAIAILEKNQSAVPSRFEEEARWRQENEIWLRLSRSIALSLIDFMQEKNLTRAELAKELGVSQQYLSRMMSGTENFSIKSIAKIEATLGISCLVPSQR